MTGVGEEIKIKHCILIYISGNTPTCHAVEEICAGIEEDGVRYEIECFDNRKLDELAFAAADDSAFGCGIGLCGSAAALQLRNFKKGEYVFYVSCENIPEMRALGKNAAAALKKQPFMIYATQSGR